AFLPRPLSSTLSNRSGQFQENEAVLECLQTLGRSVVTCGTRVLRSPDFFISGISADMRKTSRRPRNTGFSGNSSGRRLDKVELRELSPLHRSSSNRS